MMGPALVFVDDVHVASIPRDVDLMDALVYLMANGVITVVGGVCIGVRIHPVTFAGA